MCTKYNRSSTFSFFIDIKLGTDIVFGYGGATIKNIAACVLKVFQEQDYTDQVHIIELSLPDLSLLGYRQS